MKMESDSIVDGSMHTALEHLWEKYRAAFEVDDTTQTHELGRILDRGMVWAENEAGMTDILVTGINPSFRAGDTAGSFVFRYRDVQDESYYSEIRKTFFDDRLHAKQAISICLPYVKPSKTDFPNLSNIRSAYRSSPNIWLLHNRKSSVYTLA